MQTGEKSTMMIEAYKTADLSGTPDMTYQFLLNPKSFSRSNFTSYNTLQASGSSGTDVRFDKQCPEVLKFSFLIDGTGIDGDKRPADWSVEKEVEDFRKLIDYRGDTHSPYPLKIVWGKLVFKGVIKKCDYTYTLFDSNGNPLRASLDVVVYEKITDEIRVKKDKDTSPDLTHVRVVKQGDTLPLMTNSIYGDPRYYISVARANNLNNYRRLKPGQKIFFPPLK
jgi:hypothetical protein